MDIQFLYSEDCPSHEAALSRLQQVLREEGIEAEVRVREVETEEQAIRLRFAGSPTIIMTATISFLYRIHTTLLHAVPTDWRTVASLRSHRL